LPEYCFAGACQHAIYICLHEGALQHAYTCVDTFRPSSILMHEALNSYNCSACCSLHLQRLAWCLGGVGAFLLARKAAKHAYVRYKEHQARERVRKALARLAQGDSSEATGQAGSSSTAAAAGLDAAEAGSAGPGSRDAGVCVVCLSAPSEMVYVRCGHMCCCVRCSQALGAKRCPVCRAEGNVIKVFRT
jgi:E3 ubiquitin-protein ligase MUL1